MTRNVPVCHSISFLWAKSAKSVGYKRCKPFAIFHFVKESVIFKCKSKWRVHTLWEVIRCDQNTGKPLFAGKGFKIFS